MARAVPIATAEREADAAQGSVTLFFHENREKRGNTSAKVFGVGNCHVLREKINAHLASSFELPEAVDSSAASTRSRPTSVATELTPTSTQQSP
jgi:hypothetical protein